MATSVTSTPAFNGSSTYANQLAQVIAHSVAIASLPMTQLQSTQTSLTNQRTELQTISTAFSSIQAAVTSLDGATGTTSFSASVADSTVAEPSVSSGAMAGTYSLNVTSIGSQTNTISQNGLTTVSDPTAGNIDASSSYTLSINGSNYSIENPSGTLDGLAQAITNSSANVQATVVNVGSSSSPDYHLSVQSLNYAPDTIQLNDGTKDLLTTLATGTSVTYQVNGQPSSGITSSSRDVTVSPGLTVQLLKIGSTDVTVSQSASNIASALSSFTTAYNSVLNEIDKNRGQNGGALSGQSIVYNLQNQLRSLANYSSSGSSSVNSLADLGLTFDSTGALQFDVSTFDHAVSNSSNDVLNFLGSSSAGFLQTADSTLTSITDASTGILTGASTTVSNELTAIGTKITDDQTNISQLQQKLTDQMATVDATISSLQSQLSEVTGLFAQMQTNARLQSA